MGTLYRTVTSISLQPSPEKNPGRTQVVRAGEEVELDDKIAGRLLELKAIKRADEDEQEETDEVELPARPNNNATTEAWRKYLGDLGEATKELGPLEVPADAKRDEMVVIGDKRVADWNEV